MEGHGGSAGLPPSFIADPRCLLKFYEEEYSGKRTSFIKEVQCSVAGKQGQR
jgi:hypothetical protein